jgi:hypothetical protein
VVQPRAQGRRRLKDGGSIVAWGDNQLGQCNVPAPNTNFVAIAGGGSHGLGLKADGSIVAWEWNEFGQCNVPPPNSGFVAVAAGHRHSLGLKDDGSIVAWGWDHHGQCNVPPPNTGFVAVAGGTWHSLGLIGETTAVFDESGTGAMRHSLSVVPNPFRSSTTIHYALPEPTPVRLTIHDVSGRRVRVLQGGSQDAGHWHVEWNGRDDLGETVATGLYLVRLESGAETRIGRVVLVP